MNLNFNGSARPAPRPFQPFTFDGFRNRQEDRHHQPNGANFEIFDWYPKYRSCQRHFLDNAQHSDYVQTLAAFVNITLPLHRRPRAVTSSDSSPHSASLPMTMGMPSQAFNRDTTCRIQATSLIPYIRRLIATGFDSPEILHGFFGNDWQGGVGPIHEVERRNYLFAAKSGNWLEVKAEYDMTPEETIPFLKPLQRATEEELSMAEKQWSDWLAMQDWMVGPRAPDIMDQSAQDPLSPGIKREQD